MLSFLIKSILKNSVYRKYSLRNRRKKNSFIIDIIYDNRLPDNDNSTYDTGTHRK